MNHIYFLISMVGYIVSGATAVYVIANNRNNKLNRFYFIYSSTVSVFSLFHALTFVAGTPFWAEVFHHLTVFSWMLLTVIFLHFCLMIAGRDKGRNVLATLTGLYICSAALSFLDIKYHTFYLPPQMTYWGFVPIIAPTYWILSVYSALIFVFLIGLTYSSWKASLTEREKERNRDIFFALIAGTLFGVSTEMVLPAMGLYHASLLTLATTTYAVLFGLIMIKYGFLIISASELAEDIIKTMPDMMVFIDRDKTINLTNERVIAELGYVKEELVGKPIKDLFSDGFDPDHFYENLRQKGSVWDKKYSLRHKNGTVLTVIMDATLSHDRFGEEIGCVITFRDISETEKLLALQKQTAEKLAAQVVELGKLNKLTMEREDRIVELKARIKELEAKNK